MASSDFLKGDYSALGKRKINEETCRKFGYFVSEYRGKVAQVAPYRDKDGNTTAQHIRGPNKEFSWIGTPKGAQLFGAHLWSTGKKIVITEGEIDAMTVSQLQNNKWPVVSVPNGAQSARKYIAENLDFLSGFDEVILMFDMDEAGQDAIAECAPVIGMGRCKVAHLPGKDPNELFLEGRGAEVINAMWNAKPYRPDGIVTLADVRDEVLKPVAHGVPWVFPTLTELTYGRRPGELYLFGAGTGIGKTDIFTQQICHDVTVLKVPVGVFYLEQPKVETVRRVAGKHAGKQFHIPDEGWTEDELISAIDALEAAPLYLYDHFGNSDWDVIKERIRYLAVALGVKHIYLDHLTALASHADDERRFLDATLEEMSSLAQELGLIFHIVSHLATPDGTPHEEGGRVFERHFRGSRAIQQWAHYMFGLERNKQDPDLDRRLTTTFRCLKDRYTGRASGECIWLKYDQATGRLNECAEPPPPQKDAKGFGFGDEGF